MSSAPVVRLSQAGRTLWTKELSLNVYLGRDQLAVVEYTSHQMGGVTTNSKAKVTNAWREFASSGEMLNIPAARLLPGLRQPAVLREHHKPES